MRVFASVLAFSIVLAAGTAYAQAPAAPGQKPAAPGATGQKPAPPAPAAAPELKPRFQEGMKYAYVNVQAVAAASVEGKVAAEKI